VPDLLHCELRESVALERLHTTDGTDGERRADDAAGQETQTVRSRTVRVIRFVNMVVLLSNPVKVNSLV